MRGLIKSEPWICHFGCRVACDGP